MEGCKQQYSQPMITESQSIDAFVYIAISEANDGKSWQPHEIKLCRCSVAERTMHAGENTSRRHIMTSHNWDNVLVSKILHQTVTPK